MSRVVNNNRGFLQLLADCSVHQRQFLLKIATPHQLYALVQVLYNILMGHISIPPKNKRILQSYKDALLDLARPNVHYKTKKRVLVQEGSLLDLARPNIRYKTKKRVLVQVGSGFIEDLLAPVVSSVV